MERYIGTKIILAEPMDEPVNHSLSNPVPVSRRPGYRVIYEDGYTSWSPKDTFERAYRRITDAEVDLVVNPDPPRTP